MLDFRPPKDYPVLLNAVKLALPMYMRYALHGTEVHPSKGAVEKFQSYSGKRAMICPNHSNRHDPQCVFDFSAKVGEHLNFVAAREVFDWDNGRNGWWLQHLGCYSVVRGAPDRESFKMTKKILAEGKRKLVLFPEGEISRQNDTLMQLESGAAQLTFWAVDELAKAEKGKNGKLEPILIIPLALRYTYPFDIKPELGNTLSVLEHEVGVRSATATSYYARLRGIAERLLQTLEQEYGLKPAADASMNSRVEALRGHILGNVARHLNVTLAPNARQLEHVRVLRNTIDDIIYSDELEENASDYHKKIHEEKAQMLRGFYNDLNRVVNFIAIYDGYATEHKTQERFSDVLDRLETEIMRDREPSFRGTRHVLIDVGEAINVCDLYDSYKRDKKGTIGKITDEISGQISSMLVKLDGMRKPIFIE